MAPNRTPNQVFPIDWTAVADAFCQAWSSNRGSHPFFIATLFLPQKRSAQGDRIHYSRLLRTLEGDVAGCAR